jgi:hypothetical protein
VWAAVEHLAKPGQGAAAFCSEASSSRGEEVLVLQALRLAVRDHLSDLLRILCNSNIGKGRAGCTVLRKRIALQYV